MNPSRQQAFDLLKKYNKTPGLIKHALAVEATMRHFAKHFNEDEELPEIITLTIEGMCTIAGELELDGSLATE